MQYVYEFEELDLGGVDYHGRATVEIDHSPGEPQTRDNPGCPPQTDLCEVVVDKLFYGSPTKYPRSVTWDRLIDFAKHTLLFVHEEAIIEDFLEAMAAQEEAAKDRSDDDKFERMRLGE